MFFWWGLAIGFWSGFVAGLYYVKPPDREDYDQVLEVDEGAICYN